MLNYRPWTAENLSQAMQEYSIGKLPVLYLELTSKCSFCSCLYCDSASQVGKAGEDELSFDEVKKLILQLKNYGLRWVFICGLGEPHEDEKFFPLLEFLRSEGIQVSFFTNGVSYADEEVGRLADLGIHMIVKLDSMDAQIFDTLLGRRGASLQIYSFLQKLLKRNFVKPSNGTTNLAVSITPTKINANQIPRVVRYCIDNEIFPSIGDLQMCDAVKRREGDLTLARRERVALKRQVEVVLNHEYSRILCPGVFCSAHVSNTGDFLINPDTGFSCAWFLTESLTQPPKNIHVGIGNIKRDDVQELRSKMDAIRSANLPSTLSLLRAHRPVISAGGGTVPANWCDSYARVVRARARV